MEQTSHDGLSARLERWEREKRQLLAVVVVALSLCVGLTFANALARRSGTMEAEKFLLRDRSGNIRAQLAMNDAGLPCLALLDARGRSQFSVEGTSDNTAALRMFDNGEMRMSMATVAAGEASLHLYDRNHDSVTGLYMAPDSTTGLAFRNGGQELHMCVRPDGKSGVRVADPGGREVGQLGAAPPLTQRSMPLAMTRPILKSQLGVPSASGSPTAQETTSAFSRARDRRKFPRPITVD